MEIILLGTGGPKPDPNRQGPSLAVRINSTFLLFDTGRGVMTQLARAGIQYQDVNHLFITHHHFDHISGIGDFILSGWNLGRTNVLPIFGPPGTQTIVNLLLNGVYKSDIVFRQQEAQISGVTLADIKPLVETVDVGPGLVFEDQGINIYCDSVEHGHGLGISHDADALVMCCYLSRKEIQDKEGVLISEHILACAPQVGKIATKANAGKLILTHLRQKSDTEMDEMVADIRSDYDGDIIAGKDLMRISV